MAKPKLHGPNHPAEGFRVGHWSDLEGLTGCTVILPEEPAVAGVEVRGPAPGTRETELLRPGHIVERVDGVLLTGGSAFGLAAADGVVAWLEEQGRGFDAGVARVPIVPAAVLFDLALGSPGARPDGRAGYQACEAAAADMPAEGNVGAGTGATAGKLLGPRQAMKTGLGVAAVGLAGGFGVTALAVPNPVGDVIDPRSGEILAGCRRPLGRGLLDSNEQVRGKLVGTILALTSTTLAVVMTDARLTKEEANRLASLAAAGVARAIRPLTMFDGDTVFVLATGRRGRANLTALGAAAADAVAQAIVRGAWAAQPAGGLPSASSWRAGEKGGEA